MQRDELKLTRCIGKAKQVNCLIRGVKKILIIILNPSMHSVDKMQKLINAEIGGIHVF